MSGRAMIEALIAGQRSPKALAELAKGRARRNRAALEHALHGRFTDQHARLARLLLGQLDELSARIDEVTTLLDAAISALPAPTATTAPTRPATTPPSRPPPATSAPPRGCARSPAAAWTPRAVLGEIGLDMSVFGT
ncbi:MAG TPA: hypothetical protein VNT24_04085, partial [Propionibacteriaceae bacterium]|nr:hypothetical protein [Propionibacteriaceae bacterium]